MDEKNSFTSSPIHLSQQGLQSEKIAKLEEELLLVKQRCKYLEQLIEINEISPLNTLIDEYLISSKTFYKRLTTELLVCEHTEKKREKINQLVTYFNYLAKEFEKFL